jgi:hypothetical protein
MDLLQKNLERERETRGALGLTFFFGGGGGEGGRRGGWGGLGFSKYIFFGGPRISYLV